MSENVLIPLIGLAGTLLSATIFFILGKRAEQTAQTVLIRAQMLEPIDDWLNGVEKMIGIYSDTMVTLTSGSPLPITYNLEERRKVGQFMSENTNKVLGILASESLTVKRQRYFRHN